jgi:hypothetical protein
LNVFSMEFWADEGGDLHFWGSSEKLQGYSQWRWSKTTMGELSIFQPWLISARISQSIANTVGRADRKGMGQLTPDWYHRFRADRDRPMENSPPITTSISRESLSFETLLPYRQTFKSQSFLSESLRLYRPFLTFSDRQSCTPKECLRKETEQSREQIGFDEFWVWRRTKCHQNTPLRSISYHISMSNRSDQLFIENPQSIHQPSTGSESPMRKPKCDPEVPFRVTKWWCNAITACYSIVDVRIISMLYLSPLSHSDHQRDKSQFEMFLVFKISCFFFFVFVFRSANPFRRRELTHPFLGVFVDPSTAGREIWFGDLPLRPGSRMNRVG